MKEKDIISELVKKLKKGDEKAAFQLYNQYSKSMYNTLVRICGDHDDAKDALQNTFITAFTKINQLKDEQGFGAWLKKITVNAGLELLRKKTSFMDKVNDIDLPKIEEEEEELIFTERQIHEAIQLLPTGSRLVVNLYLIEGYAHKEIAKKLRIKESTSKTQYKRGKELLRIQLRKQLQHG